MTQTFEYKPALFSKMHKVSIEDDQMTLTQGDDTKLLSYDNVKSVRYWSMTVKGSYFQGLDFTSKDGRDFNIRKTLGRHAERSHPEHVEFRKTMVATLKAFATARPEAEIELGQKKGMKWAFFLIGCASALFALGMVAAGLFGGIRPSKFADAIAPILIMLMFAATLIWSYNPFKKPVTMSAQVALALIGAGEAADRETAPKGSV